MNAPVIRLSDDLSVALLEIAAYLRTARRDRERRHFELTGPEGLGKEFVGYWQTDEWFDGLFEIAAEADRIVRDSSTALDMTRGEGGR